MGFFCFFKFYEIYTALAWGPRQNTSHHFLGGGHISWNWWFTILLKLVLRLLDFSNGPPSILFRWKVWEISFFIFLILCWFSRNDSCRQWRAVKHLHILLFYPKKKFFLRLWFCHINEIGWSKNLKFLKTIQFKCTE